MTRRRTNRLGVARGMTLVEIMIVVIVMALIATGVAFAVTPMVVTGRETQTQSDVRVIQNAVSLYLVQHGVCPGSIDDLTLSRAARRVDAWDNAFAIECDVEQEPMVVSAGQDGQQGTADDIRSADDGSPDSSAGDLGGGIVRAGY